MCRRLYLHGFAALNLFPLENVRFSVKDVDGFYSHFDEVAGAVEESAEVAGDFACAVHEGGAVGLADDAEELVNGVVGVYGYGFA